MKVKIGGVLIAYWCFGIVKERLRQLINLRDFLIDWLT